MCTTTRILSFSAAIVLSIGGAVAHADQEALLKVKSLYAAAAYEDALVLMASVPRETRVPELDQYRAFCLIALGDKSQAQQAIEQLLLQNPLYQPDTADTSPRIVETFREMRVRALPSVAKRLYTDAKLALERKERATAIEQFETLLRFISAESSNDPTLDDMKVLANGFLDLSRALPAAAAPAVAKEPPTASAEAAPRPTSWTRPVPLKQELPRWNAPDSISRRASYDGILRVRVTADGKVESAEIVRRTHPMYDGLLIRAAASWLYEPAKQDGVAVPAEVLVEVQLRPQE
jgi:hypothetical protein